jgi:hypothetical protein
MRGRRIRKRWEEFSKNADGKRKGRGRVEGGDRKKLDGTDLKKGWQGEM